MIDSARDGILENTKETVTLVPKLPSGLLTPQILTTFSAIAQKYQIPAMKITSAQRIAFVGVKPEQVESIWADLAQIGIVPGAAAGNAIHYIQACPGTDCCRLGQRDSLALAQKIDQAIAELPIPAKTKIGISGCPLSCGEGIVRDIGIFGKKATGWTVQIGGCSGINARLGEVIAKDLSDEDTLALVIKLLTYYNQNAKPRERMYRFVPRIGLEQIKQDLSLS